MLKKKQAMSRAGAKVEICDVFSGHGGEISVLRKMTEKVAFCRRFETESSCFLGRFLRTVLSDV